MSKKDKELLGHYVGNYLLKARLSLEDGNKDLSDKIREELIKKLKGLEEDSKIEKCIECLESVNWYTTTNINIFQDFYTQLDSEKEKHL